MRYIALLRGINVGGNKKVPMAELKTILEKGGLENIRTLLATGNVAFESNKEEVTLKKNIETLIEEHFHFKVPVIIRTLSSIQTLVNSEPFDSISLNENTKLYVTFLSEKPKSTLKIPYESEQKDFKIIKIENGLVLSVLELSENYKSTDAMNILEKEFTKNVTTRNWNTVQKIANM